MSAPSTINSGVISAAVPKTMRAGVYREKGVVRVEEVPVPEVGINEVLIKVADERTPVGRLKVRGNEILSPDQPISEAAAAP